MIEFCTSLLTLPAKFQEEDAQKRKDDEKKKMLDMITKMPAEQKRNVRRLRPTRLLLSCILTHIPPYHLSSGERKRTPFQDSVIEIVFAMTKPYVRLENDFFHM